MMFGKSVSRTVITHIIDIENVRENHTEIDAVVPVGVVIRFSDIFTGDPPDPKNKIILS